ncbi:AbrB/MazE/SpoVT family DNA-binding domain-containing protein [Dyadobacter sp.]|uniref:AbrB/MazE/SpoVT family DNA-binding domain-containing protein n=1 Tax=Dyadobacter sp. TaxID=1914288 RepID=UPI003F6F2EF1
MKANIISIGNSQGIIIPSVFLRQLKLSSKSSVQVEVSDGVLMIKPDPRQGWAEAAARMHAAGDDKLLLEDSMNEFDKEEWTWEDGAV